MKNPEGNPSEDYGVGKRKSVKKTITALSLQGGGARGAYEYGVLKAICELRGKAFRPRAVAGISIGAINGAVLIGAKGDPMEALDELWRKRFCVTGPADAWLSWLSSCMAGGFPFPFADVPEQNLSWFGNPGMYSLRPEFVLAPVFAAYQHTSIYDTDALKKTLADLIDIRKLNRPDETRFIVTAANVTTGQHARFDNAKGEITLSHILASGSFPVTFPMTRIGGHHYWDGGVFINLPIAAAVNALEDVEADDPDVERELIFVELHKMKEEIPRSILGATERFYNMLFSGKMAIDRKILSRYRTFVDLVQEIEKVIPADSPIRKHPGYKELSRHRRINKAIIIGEKGIGARGSSSDFSRKTLEHRIDAGYRDALAAFAEEAR
jgi:NTE family protein